MTIVLNSGTFEKRRRVCLPAMTTPGPLADYRVLELGSTAAGPFCAKLLADFGAEVV